MKKDPITGQFLPGHKLSPEHKQKMEEGRQKAKEARERNQKELLLVEMGFNPENIPTDVDVLAEKFLKESSIPAHTKLLQLSPKFSESALGWNGKGIRIQRVSPGPVAGSSCI